MPTCNAYIELCCFILLSRWKKDSHVSMNLSPSPRTTKGNLPLEHWLRGSLCPRQSIQIGILLGGHFQANPLLSGHLYLDHQTTRDEVLSTHFLHHLFQFQCFLLLWSEKSCLNWVGLKHRCLWQQFNLVIFSFHFVLQ